MNTWKIHMFPSDFHISVSPPMAASCRGRWPSLLLGRATGKMNQLEYLRRRIHRERGRYIAIMCVHVTILGKDWMCMRIYIHSLNIYIYTYTHTRYMHTRACACLWTLHLISLQVVLLLMSSWARERRPILAHAKTSKAKNLQGSSLRHSQQQLARFQVTLATGQVQRRLPKQTSVLANGTAWQSSSYNDFMNFKSKAMSFWRGVLKWRHSLRWSSLVSLWGRYNCPIKPLIQNEQPQRGLHNSPYVWIA